MQTFSLINTGSGNDATVVSNTPAQILGIDCMNSGASPAYLKLYDINTSPTNGLTPIRRYMIPSSGGLVRVFDQDLIYTRGIGFRITAGIADADTADFPGSTVLINIDWD